eukprot:TCONS_00058710-protein
MEVMYFCFLVILGILQTSSIVFCTTYNIGVLINNATLEENVLNAKDDINDNPSLHGLGASSRLNVTVLMLPSDPVQATKDICSHLISKSVYVVITTNAQNSTHSPDIVSYACAFYKIPTIAVQSRNTELSDKNLHPSLLRTVPAYADQARVWADLIRHFKWNKVNLLTSDDYDSRVTYIKFTSWAYKFSIVIERPIMFPAHQKNLTSFLSPLNGTQSKVLLLACSAEDAVTVFRTARALDLTGESYIWITNQQALSSQEGFDLAPQGLLSLRLYDEEKVEGHLRDAFMVTANAIGRLQRTHQLNDPPPNSCDEPSGKWTTGDDLYEALVNTTVQGSTGTVTFDPYGDRKTPAYELLNVRENKDGTKFNKEVGVLDGNEAVSVDLKDIIWPGNQTDAPTGVFISNHLRIVTVESKPFVYVVERPASGDCSELDGENGRTQKHLPCTGPSSKFPNTRDHCCKGFCMDLLVKLAEKVNFTYDLHLVEDGNFGSLQRVNGSNIKRWNGLIGEVIEGKADLIVTSLTINNERAQYIEFSKPFKYQGITILVKKNTNKSDLSSFLRPFKPELWLLVLLSVHVVAVILYLLDRFSPFGRYRLAQSNKEETALNLSSAMWFSWGVLLNSGIGEGTPRSFSARVLGMVWAGFAMIIVASYTANLAAFLVLDRPKPVVTGVDDPNLRNPSDLFKYATVAKSSVDAYFRRQVELSSMYTFMEKHNVKTEQEGIEKVKNGELKAFIWDSPVLFHETSQNCDVSTVGDLFGRSGYGIGMPKGSPWSNEISLAVLHFHESGAMEELESTWIDFGNCQSDSNSPTTLGLQHMLGVFIMVAAGIGAGIVIVILEVLYYKHKGWRKQQQKVIKKTTEQWQEHVQERKHQTGGNENSSRSRSRASKSSKENGVDHLGNGNNPAGFKNPIYDVETSAP